MPPANPMTSGFMYFYPLKWNNYSQYIWKKRDFQLRRNGSSRYFKHTLSVASEPIIYDFNYVMQISIIIELWILFAAAFYLFVHFGLRAGLKRLDNSISTEHPFVSIIIAARNEEKNICRLLQCLSNQTYPQCEIIIVNDRSTDGTAQLVADFRKNCPNVSCITITSFQDGMPAKKNALIAGINASKGEILCFTDADCFPPPTWVDELVKSFKPDVGLVAGYSPYQIPSDNFSRMDSLIKYSSNSSLMKSFVPQFGRLVQSVGILVGSAQGEILLIDAKCSMKSHQFEKIKMSISGDDDLFLQLVRRQTDWKIYYIKTRESFVPTVPPMNFWSFVEQRKRHFSAAKFFTLPMMIFFFTYHSSNLLLLVSPLLFLTNVLNLPVTVTVFCIKLLSDFVLYKYSNRTFESSNFNRSFMLMEAL